MTQASSIIEGAILFSSFEWSKNSGTLTIDNPNVVMATGAFSGQSSVSFYDLDYSPFASLSTLWETEDFSFAIESLSIVSETTSGLELQGSGMLSDKAGLLENTFGLWAFSGGRMNWSSISQAADVPEPATLALLSFGLAALGYSRRKTK